MFKHQQNYDHNIDWERSKLIYKCDRQTERLLVESVIIKKTNNMNLSDGLYKLDEMILTFLDNCKHLTRSISEINT